MQTLTVVDFLDVPEVLDASITPIPSRLSNPLQIIASVLRPVVRITSTATLGQWIGVYLGATGQEVLACLLACNGDEEKDINIPAGSRVSVRAVDPADITSGSLCIQFLGYR